MYNPGQWRAKSFQQSKDQDGLDQEGLVFLDIAGINLRCTKQLDKVRKEQLDRGVARPCFEFG